MRRLDSSFVEMVYFAALKSFWRRNALGQFLRQHGVRDSFLASRAELTKKQVLDAVFAHLVASPDGPRRILGMAADLGGKVDFPDLLGWENSQVMLEEARQACAALRKALGARKAGDEHEQRLREVRQRAEQRHSAAQRARRDLEALDQRLMQLARGLGTQSAGYAFQDWFYDLVDHFDTVHRRPYLSEGRQIDGSITLSGTTYLVELKFTREQVGVADVDSLHRKVSTKADNTMGICVSMAGYSRVAIAEASGPRTPLLLLDHSHIVHCLRGLITFGDLVERVRRHASQTGEAYLRADLLGF